nr:hypothetical protein [Tanacetum cinerariifolium]
PFHTKKIFTTLRVHSPSFSGRIVPLFDNMLIQQGEGSGAIGDKSGDDAPIKGKSSNEGEAAIKGVINDLEEIARVLTTLDAANVLAGETNVPTGSGSIPTAGPSATIVSTGSEVGPTASLIVQRRKGKE